MCRHTQEQSLSHSQSSMYRGRHSLFFEPGSGKTVRAVTYESQARLGELVTSAVRAALFQVQQTDGKALRGRAPAACA